ncbi:hypothetical protein HBH56_218900 [Parastagonospora nodorum]|uniref:Xylanolytic transcriptional activator regulatory domain-containing protein n=1 Tax=Phaeosphaeria nodorum (strain SN15 / ATCC MYA-4574 / FGSC 10173) TaxID=321614 RepID=A0A7U2F9C8_PHANO|nr:hypothetical protein HBH56_218900 [Parastagonospora nodorum]QRD01141.1 hypothetical protein JI435_158150 [Parastagonospora nodorum SN15]KAH3922042.1 hypothetical protein HBH54_229020 [Parastagonospora nodorum]KAH3941323.1 hypothetical protein HBH53_202910 [Parastagonospora nodorum]KAH3958681.1 hypothetical protein HBH51_206170 [Parastagonospora nodorum]
MTGLVFNRMTAITPTEPLPIQRTIILWQVFTQRIEPLVRIMYRWVVEDLRTRSTSMELQTSLTPAERALIMAVCYTSVNSLTNDECRSMLQLERATLLTECRFQCEDALVHTNMFCMTDLNVIRAVVFYIMGSFDRVSTHSLWSLLGMTIRNAEKLGLHRDGAVLGLSPMATEERRRLWWQLQHLDLGAAVRMGLTPMTLTAGWDVKMPLNIEDEDLYASSTTAPPEKRGLTSLSYNLFTYWVLDQQRQNFLSKHGRFELSWLTNSAMSSTTKDDMLSLLEDGVNRHFVQFCDPINPLHVLLQLLTRSFITNMQLRVMHGRACTQGDSEHRTILLNASMQSLRYHIALMSQTSLSCYQWLTRVWFSWQAFMVVLVEASDTSNVVKAQELWDLLASVYASNADMFDLADDRRRLQAAEHVVAAWKAYPGRFDGQLLRQPPFILEVAQRLTTHRAGLDPGSMQPDYTPQEYKEEVLETPAEMPEGTFFDAEFDFEFDMELQDIDWSFWSSID